MQVFFSIINSLCVVFGVLAFLILGFGKRQIFSFRILAVTLLVEILCSLVVILLSYHLFEKFPHLYRIFAPFLYLLGPSFYLFFRTLLYNETKFRKWDWLHALPFLLHTIELMPFYLSPVLEKLIEISKIDLSTMAQLVTAKEGFLVAQWHSKLKGLSIIIYSLVSFRIYFKFKKIAFDSVIENNKTILKFAYWFLIMIGISQIGVFLPIFFLIFHDFAPTYSMYALRFSNTIIISFLVGYLFFNPSILYGINFTNRGTDKIIKSLKENLKLNEAKLRAYLVSETEMLVYVDKDFKIIQFNQLAEKLVLKKFMRQIKVGEDYRTYLHNSRESLFFVEFEKAISGQRCGYEIELSMNGYDIAKWVKIEFIPIANELNEIIGVNICSINIQGRKALEQQNKNYLKQLQDITWRESHLLRAPVSNLMGIARLLNKPDSTVSEVEKKALLQMIEREATKLDLEIKNIVSSTTSNKT